MERVCDGPRGEGDVVADDPELVDCSVPGLVGVAPCVVVRARVAVGGLFGEHVPDRDEHGVLDGDDGLEGSTAGGDAPVLGGEVGALCPGGGHGRDAQGALEVGVGWSGVGGPAPGPTSPPAGSSPPTPDQPTPTSRAPWASRPWPPPGQRAPTSPPSTGASPPAADPSRPSSPSSTPCSSRSGTCSPNKPPTATLAPTTTHGATPTRPGTEQSTNSGSSATTSPSPRGRSQTRSTSESSRQTTSRPPHRSPQVASFAHRRGRPDP